jgi:hypothetical protein
MKNRTDTGGLRTAPTSGYTLATLRVALTGVSLVDFGCLAQGLLTSSPTFGLYPTQIRGCCPFLIPSTKEVLNDTP